jgi:hypothetical protein
MYYLSFKLHLTFQDLYIYYFFYFIRINFITLQKLIFLNYLFFMYYLSFKLHLTFQDLNIYYLNFLNLYPGYFLLLFFNSCPNFWINLLEFRYYLFYYFRWFINFILLFFSSIKKILI